MMEFSGSRCLVTGGAGFIGSNIVRTLLEQGADVTVIDDFSTGKPERLPDAPSLRIVQGDLATMPDLGSVVADCDVVFHLAAQVSVVRSLDATEEDALRNVMGSVRLFAACRDTRVRRIVYSSSCAIFGEPVRLPVDENHPQRPTSFYALSKLTAEKYGLLEAELSKLPVTCLRYFNVYGMPLQESDYAGVISIFISKLLAGEPLVIYGNGSQYRDFVYVQDVVQANLLAASNGATGGVYNIGTGVPTTILELAHILGELAGVRPEIRFKDWRAGEIRGSVADVKCAQAELGFTPTYDLRSGLEAVWRGALHAVPSPARQTPPEGTMAAGADADRAGDITAIDAR
jgi:UDP-glucose 4-epimerase